MKSTQGLFAEHCNMLSQANRDDMIHIKMVVMLVEIIVMLVEMMLMLIEMLGKRLSL